LQLLYCVAQTQAETYSNRIKVSNSTVQVLGEMGLIGAVVCGIAIVPALFLSRQVSEPET